MDTLTIGKQAEANACQFLETKGFKLLARNYYCRFGEIDLIMKDRDEIVFVEVRQRASDHVLSPVESVNLTKQRKLIKTATHYLQQQRWFDKVSCRFDVVGITQDEIEWIKDAFSADYFC